MLAAAERIFGFLEEDDEARDAENFISTDGLVGNVEFNHVHFGYTDDKIIINDFNAKVKDGQRTSSPTPIPHKIQAKCKASVQFATETASST